MDDDAAIRNLFARYCHLIDDARFAEWASLFTVDGTFRTPLGDATGHEALESFITDMLPPERRGRHLCANTMIDVEGDRASAVTDYVFMAPVDGGFAVRGTSRYYDVLVRVEDSWRFAERTIVPFAQPG